MGFINPAVLGSPKRGGMNGCMARAILLAQNDARTCICILQAFLLVGQWHMHFYRLFRSPDGVLGAALKQVIAQGWGCLV